MVLSASYVSLFLLVYVLVTLGKNILILSDIEANMFLLSIDLSKGLSSYIYLYISILSKDSVSIL